MNIKEQIKSLQYSRFPAGKAIYNLLKKCNHLIKLLTDGVYRGEHYTKRKFKDYYQRSLLTAHNRYPLLFAQSKSYLSTIKNPFILSFGCSTGEEVATISEYIPDANIMGIDINEWCIRQCKKKHNNPRFHFHHRASNEFEGANNFDAIFCMAVFQRTENRLYNNIAQQLTFEQFEKEILLLDNKLKPGGLFIIENSDFRFTDTSCSKHYAPLIFEKSNYILKRPHFGKNNKKIADVQNNPRIFVKIPASENAFSYLESLKEWNANRTD
jgi:hypothetical protein